MQLLRRLLVAEAVAFWVAAAIHGGVLVPGLEDPAAALAEAIIGAVLLAAAVVSRWRSATTWAMAIAGQAFALLGSLVGLWLLVTVGPARPPDLALHVGIIVVLVAGLGFATRRPDRDA